MRNVIKSIRYIFTLLFLYLLAGISYTYSQEAVTDTLPESAYKIDVPKHVVNIYSNFVPYVLFGIVIALILYVSFRYWNDNRPHPHNHYHTPQH
jgi:hypothetical protein